MRIVLQNFQHVRDDVSLLPDVGEGEKSDVGAKVDIRDVSIVLRGWRCGSDNWPIDSIMDVSWGMRDVNLRRRSGLLCRAEGQRLIIMESLVEKNKTQRSGSCAVSSNNDGWR